MKKNKNLISKMKNVFSLILIISLFVFTLTPIKGYENNYKEILLENGFPEEIIDTLTADEIKYQAENNFMYINTTVQTFSFLKNYEEIQPMGTIPSSDMKIYITTSQSFTSGKINEIFVKIQYKWLKHTVFGGNQKDAWAVNWDNANMRYKDDSFSGYTNVYQNSTLLAQKPTYDSLSKVGSYFIGSYVDQINSNNKISVHNISFYLRPISGTATSSGSIQFYISYAHKIMSISGITINGPQSPNLNVTFSGTYDSVAKAVTISW